MEYLLEYIQGIKEKVEIMPCRGCGGKRGRVSIPAPPASFAAAGTQRGVKPSEMVRDEEYVMVVYDTANISNHKVVGMATRTDYGLRKAGDRFLMHKNDQAHFPNLFKPISQVEQIMVDDGPKTAPPPPPQPTVEVQEMKGGGPMEVEPVIEEEPKSPSEMTTEELTLYLQGIIPGMSTAAAKGLAERGITDAQGILGLGIEGLTEIHMVGKQTAERILNGARLALDITS